MSDRTDARAPHVAARTPYLYRSYPGLRGRLPWQRLGTFPTPVARLAALGRQVGHDQLYVKRDDLSGSLYGGNKVRKLEFSLADAAGEGGRPIVTFGAAGSNHVLATTLYARELGLPTVGVMVPQPVQAYVRRNLLANQAAGCHLLDADGLRALPRLAEAWIAAWRAHGARPYLLPPGGSSTLGVIGYVEAALELAAQVAEGLLPEPDFAFVPVGTCGTLAGLVAGLKLAGLRTVPVGIRVYSRKTANERVTAFLANRALRLLRRLDPAVPAIQVRPDDVVMRHGWFGPTYGQFTRAGVAAVHQARAAEGLELEGCYSGKAMAAFLELMRQPAQRGRVGLFVDTHNSRPLDPLTREAEGPAALPPGLRAYFDRDVAPVAEA